MHPGLHSRDRIADELWPGGLVKAQCDSLKTALTKIRRALPPDVFARCVYTTRSELGIPEEAVSTDVGEMAQRLDDDDREGALALMRGNLLAGLRMDWIDDLRSTQQLMESGLLTSLATEAAAAGDHRRAIDLTRRRLALDPLDEDASLTLMQHLLAAGRHRAALEEHERLARAHRRAGLVHHPSVAMQQLTATLPGGLSLSHKLTATVGGELGAADILPEALHSFRWDAYLRAPAAGDDHPDFAVESIRIAYRAAHLPEVLRVACLAADTDDALRSLTMESGYWFRWIVDPSLDPSDERVFATDPLLIDGRSIPRESVEPLDFEGGRGVVHLYRIPDLDRLRLHSVDLLARTRLYVGDDRRVRAVAGVHRPVTDAEFRLTVSESIRARKISIGTGQVTPLATEGTPICGPLFEPWGGVTGALARFSYPLQQGSGVTFEVLRDPVTTVTGGGAEAVAEAVAVAHAS